MRAFVHLNTLVALYSGLGVAGAVPSSSDLYATPLFQSLTCGLRNVNHNGSGSFHDHDVVPPTEMGLDNGRIMVDFSLDESSSSSSSSWEVRPSAGKGLGVFATAPIRAGERIMVEEPLFAITPPEFVPGRGYDLSAMVASLDAAVASLSPLRRDEFRSCHGHYLPGEGEAEQDMVVFRSNAYTLTDGTIAMFPRIARINHSCRPNAANVWSGASGQRVIWAARDIAQGEEVTVTYAPLLKASKERQGRLAQYGFQCGCEACSGHSHTDPARVRMGRLLAELEDRLGRNTSQVANRKLLPKATELVQLMEEEHMMDYLPNVYHLAAELCYRLEDFEGAAAWSAKALRLHEYADEGSHDADKERNYLDGIPH